jgi:Fe-S-cluster containining protein
MKDRESRRRLTRNLVAVAAAYQSTDVIPHCIACTKPCCRLDPLVLELDWKQLKTLWQIETSRTAFDRQLNLGQGPTEIRAAEGLYFAHGRTCPAYDETARSCRIYGQEIKPVGCSDFPVYEDQSHVIADLRCEAVHLDTLITKMANAVGPEYRIVHSADEAFPFLVTLSVRQVATRRKKRG